MASSRLPGKAMLPLAGRALLGRCLDRLVAAAVAPVVLATTTNAEDDVLEADASARGLLTLRGPAADVLTRFVMVANVLDARVLVRATADNPAVDIDAPHRVLERQAATRADYVAEVGLPYAAPGAAAPAAGPGRPRDVTADPADLEHVTLAVKRMRSRFAVVDLPAPPHVRRPDLRLTVDTPDDLRFMGAVLSRFDPDAGEARLSAIISAADSVLGEVLA
jgi:spore coat polysaccharide biosynthesis protein SpsF